MCRRTTGITVLAGLALLWGTGCTVLPVWQSLTGQDDPSSVAGQPESSGGAAGAVREDGAGDAVQGRQEGAEAQSGQAQGTALAAGSPYQGIQPVSASEAPELLPAPASGKPGTAETPADPPPELSLLEVVQMALAANPDLQSARERTQYAEQVLARARADFFPTLGFNENYQSSNNPLRKFTFLLSQGVSNPNQLFNPPDVLDNFHSQLQLQQDVYNGGLRVARTLSAEADRVASIHTLSAARNRIVFQVAEAYYHLFQARDLVKVRKESVEQVEKQLETVKSRFKAQTATRSDVLMVELRLAEEREGQITARNAFELAWAVLENVAGVPLANRALPEQLPPAPWADHVDRVLAAIEQAGTGSESEKLNAAVQEAIAERPELSAIGSRIQSAQHLVRAAASGKYPSVAFVGDYDVFTGDFRAQTTQHSYFIGLALSLNIFDGGRTRTSVRQAQARVRELSAQERRARLDIMLDVRRAYLQFKDASERLRVARVAVVSAQESLRSVESRYASQTATVTELLASQVILSDARVKVSNGQAEVEVARAALERAIGRLATLMTDGENNGPCVVPPESRSGSLPLSKVPEAGTQIQTTGAIVAAPPASPALTRGLCERVLGAPWNVLSTVARH
jgi:outer membrane protein